MSTKKILSIVSLLSILSLSLAGSSIKIQVFEDVLFQGKLTIRQAIQQFLHIKTNEEL